MGAVFALAPPAFAADEAATTDPQAILAGVKAATGGERWIASVRGTWLASSPQAA
jgi:hypothetical protein